MADVEQAAGFRVYRDHRLRKSYHRDQLRITRNKYVVETLFPERAKTLLKTTNHKLFKNLNSLQQISDAFFQRVKLDHDALEAFKNVLGKSFEAGTINFEAFLAENKANHLVLLELMFKTLAQNYDKILELENQAQALTDENAGLNAYVADLLEEMTKLQKFASDCNEMRISELGIQSEEYQMLYERYSGTQEQLDSALQRVYSLEKKLAARTSETAREAGDSMPEDFQVPQENLSLFEPVVEDTGIKDKLREYEKRVKELERSNEALFEEKRKLAKAAQEHVGSDKFVTLSMLLHQVTKSLHKLFQGQHERRESESYETLRLTLMDARFNTLEYENRTYKDRLTEVEDLLRDETVERCSLESAVSQLKMELYQAQQVYHSLENANAALMRSELDLNRVRTDRDVRAEQLGKMQHVVSNLTREKHDLVSKVASLEFTRGSLLREAEVLKEQLHKVEKLLVDQYADRFDFRDKIENIQLQANTKILEDKLARIKQQLDETKAENANLTTSMGELRNSLEQERRQNSELLKKAADAVQNEARLTVEIQQLASKASSVNAAIGTHAENLRTMSNEMGLMRRKMFEQELQMSSLAAKRDMATGMLEELAGRLAAAKVSPADLYDLKKLDLKTADYNELMQALTGGGSAAAGTPPRRELREEEMLANVDNLVKFNQLMVTLCANLAKELGTLNANMLNVTNFSNIFETFNIDLVNVDTLKNEYATKIHDLETRAENVERLSRELKEDRPWEKSVVRMREKYNKSLNDHKVMLKECRRLLNTNENAINTLLDKNAQLHSDCVGAAAVIKQYEEDIDDARRELGQLKERIYNTVPSHMRLSTTEQNPIRSLELVASRLAALPPQHGLDLSATTTTALEEPPRAQPEPPRPREEPAPARAAPSEPAARPTDEQRDHLLESKEQQLNEVYENVSYYCKLIAKDIKAQLHEEHEDTDYEWSNANEAMSDDTISEYMDEDYLVDKFEEILDLLGRLAYSSKRGDQSPRSPSEPAPAPKPTAHTAALDTSLIRCVTKFTDTLKRQLSAQNNQNAFVLEDLEFQFESLQTIAEPEDKLRKFCASLTKLLNMAGNFVQNQLNENADRLSQLMKNLESSNAELQQLEHMHTLKDQQIKATQFELNDLKTQLGQLEQLYAEEKSHARQLSATADRHEYERRALTEDLNALRQKNEKLMMLVSEYQQIVQLLKS